LSHISSIHLWMGILFLPFVTVDNADMTIGAQVSAPCFHVLWVYTYKNNCGLCGDSVFSILRSP
jgi:hypothetical protein